MSLPDAQLRPWSLDPRYLARVDGVVFGPRGHAVGTLDKRTGYVIVSWRGPSGRTSVGAHAIVCDAFHGPAPAPGMQAAHGNDVRNDNRPGNLRWDTPEGNQRDQVRHGTRRSQLTEAAVREIRASAESSRVVGLRFGVSQVTIVQIRNRRTWREVA